MLLGSFEDDSLLSSRKSFSNSPNFWGLRESCGWNPFRGEICRLSIDTDKYHYNHTPVAGRVLDIYELSGDYHSCNPQAVVSLITPYSKNKRVVTILDTDTPGGTGVGLVAMVEVVALMVGDILQCYSSRNYDLSGAGQVRHILGKRPA